MHRPAERVPRFSAAERWVHRTTAWLVGTLLLTGAVLYVGPLSLLVGRRPVVAGLHVVAGLLLPLPTLLGLADRGFREDLRRLNRFAPHDWEWLRRADRRTAALPVGKFNAGQKLAASFVAGASLVLLGTGLVMVGPGSPLPFRVSAPVGWREGATLVHDLLAGALLVLLAGHVRLAYRHPDARAAMRHGSIGQEYAAAAHPEWYAEITQAREP